MSDLNWCTFCDKAISVHSNSLYCSEECLRHDALSHHPLLGYNYAELKDFPRSSAASSPPLSSASSASSVSSASFSSQSPTLSFQFSSSLRNDHKWGFPRYIELGDNGQLPTNIFSL